MRHSIAARFALCMFAPALLGTSAQALAASDVKSFSTNVCVPVGTAASNDLTYSHLGLLNTSTTSSRVVICPLLKDAESIWGANETTLAVDYRSPAGSGGAVKRARREHRSHHSKPRPMAALFQTAEPEIESSFRLLLGPDPS